MAQTGHASSTMASSEHEQDASTTKYPLDATFRSANFTSKHAISYASHRPSYPPALISRIIEFHTTTGGGTEVLVDVGCGPGTATRLLSPYFSLSVTGVDPGDSMIKTAQELLRSWTPEEAGNSGKVRFEQATAESLHDVPGIEVGSVDMITAATAAHWFDLPLFYASAARILKPGGTIAIWICSNGFADPRTTPHADEVQNVWRTYEEYLINGGFYNPGNVLSRDNYKDLKLPWTVKSEIEKIKDETERATVKDSLEMFDEAGSTRWDFNLDGKPDYETFPDLDVDVKTQGQIVTGNGFLYYTTVSLKQVEYIMGTASTVIRWREAHKDALEKGELKDCIQEMLEDTLKAMELPIDADLKNVEINTGTSIGVVLIKKKT